MGSRMFRSKLTALLRQQRMTGPRLATAISYSRGYVWEVTSGRKPALAQFAAACDKVLNAGGGLVAALAAPDPEAGGQWARRQRLSEAGLLAAASLVGTEAVRHGLGAALRGGIDLDEWDQIADEYAHEYCCTPPERLLPDLSADLAWLSGQLSVAGAATRGVYRVAGQLSAIMAVALASAGAPRRARGWWRTACEASDRSGDVRTQAFVRGWEVVDGLYEARPVPEILGRAQGSVALLDGVVCAGAAELYAGLAQTLAVVGRRGDALRALARVADLTGRMPPAVTDDDESLLGWPEVRLRHTESYVYTWLGDVPAASAAQEQALRLYRPESPARQPTQVKLHRAAGMLRAGDVAGGLAYASAVLDDLPAEQHNDHVYALGRAVLAFVPRREWGRPDAAELRERLTAPADR
jgi:hypothetical protein